MGFEVLCSKGSGSDESVTITEEDLAGLAGKKLSDLRAVLEKKVVNEKPFIKPDSSTCQYRFVMAKADRTAENYSDRIVGLSTEGLICLSDMFINDKNQIVLTDTKKQKKPDLIGFATDYWTGGKLRVKCRKKPDAAKNVNKFDPLMLTNVVPTNEKIQLHYDNVCICCEDSVVEFPIRCFGTVGFEYKAQLASGEIIKQNAMHWAIGDTNLYGGATINFWKTKDGPKEIVMKAIEHVSGIDPATKMSYQKITFTARDMRSWINGDDWNKVIDVNTLPKNKVAQAQVHAFTRSLNGREPQVTIDGETITPGTLQPGDTVGVNYGNWWPKDCDAWENPLGTVSVYLFVFTSLEEAKKLLGQYNMMPPDKQVEKWF